MDNGKYTMKILGIDPGIGRMGWGAIEVESSKFKVQSFGCVETSAKLSVEDRLLEVHDQVQKIIKEYEPEVMAIEELFFNTNAKTAFVVGQARGVILLAAAQAQIPIAIYTPLQVKIAVAGYGRAEKKQMGIMVKTLLDLKEVPKLDDTADALAIAITHAVSYKVNKHK